MVRAAAAGTEPAALSGGTARRSGPGLLAATSNAGKLKELRLLLPEFRLVSPETLGLRLEVAEDGDSFRENAAIKARAGAAVSGRLCIADDSGLEVDALGGKPGIFSARYGGPALDDADRCRLLLSNLTDVGEPAERSARFVCCAVVAAPDRRSCFGEGTCEGRIATEAAGAGGFGYDPVFYLPREGRTMAELSADEKNRISHCTRALAALRGRLPEVFPELGSSGAALVQV